MIAFLFPGQGSQRPGLLADCVARLDARDVMWSASDVLGRDVLRDDDARAIECPEIVQRNVFLAGISGARALRLRGVEPGAVAGHSVGAFVAATTAGVLTFEDALALVTKRAGAMTRALGDGYGMGAILGLSEAAVRALLPIDAPDIDIAAINARDQIVVSGSLPAVDRALEIARSRGARSARRLAVPVASHTSLMSSVRDELARAFATVECRNPACAVAANVDGRAMFGGGEVAVDLCEGVSRPVRWWDATQMLFERGVRLFIEPFLGDTLTLLAENVFDDAVCVSLGRDGLASAVRLAERYG